MKDWIRRMLLVMMVIILAAGTAWAEEDDDSDYEWDYDKYIEECRKYIGTEGDVLVLREGVVTTGSYYGERDESSWKYIKDPAIKAVFNDYPGFSFSGDAMDDEVPDYDSRYFSTVKWPSTLRMMGNQSFHALRFGTLPLPASLERIEQDAFIYCHFDTLRIECELPFEQISWAMYDCGISAYDASEENTMYKAVDGVLYSKDGKTLIAYPNIREDEHFDVPAGVEHIGSGAFDNEHLKTISLPIGLKTIESYAFADCTRLQAIAVPLTVTSIGHGILYNCISLERVSLPEGLEADKDDYCTYYKDDRIYRGDNGNTYDIGIIDKKESEGQGIRADFCWIKDGEETLAFASREGNRAVALLAGGTPVTAVSAFLDRTLVEDPLTSDEIGWVDTKKLDIFVEDELFYLYGKPKDGLFPDDEVPEDEWEWDSQYGPWILINSQANILIPLEDARLCRYPDEKYGDNELGVITDRDIMKRLALLDAPEGKETTVVHVGTQIRILEEQDDWVRVTTGYDEGWIRTEQIRIVPEIEDGEEIWP